MSTEKSRKQAGFWGGLLTASLYKRNQGRMVRQVTGVAAGLVILFGSYSLSQGLPTNLPRLVGVGVPMLIVALGAWVIFRAVNYPRFADFLIAVEAEMAKVSWASWTELKQGLVVVIATMFFLAFVLLAYDFIWQFFFRFIKFLQI